MFSDRVFQVAFLISFIVHGAILLGNPSLSLVFQQNKQEQKLEVSYVKPPRETKTETPKAPAPKKEPFLKIPPRITMEKKMPPPAINKENIFKIKKTISPQGLSITKPALMKPDIIAIKKKITLPPIDINKINNPSYISYYQIVREKIKRAAYQNYTGREQGEVTISFVVSNKGDLKELRLVEEKSHRSSYLRGTALKSIKEASPFPSFPKELDYPQLSFNLTITFEVE